MSEPAAEPVSEPAAESVAEPAPRPEPAGPTEAPAELAGPTGLAQPAQPAELPQPAQPAEVPTVVIRLAGSRYALEMDAIAEVGRPPRITRVPGVPSWVAGVANWRGRVLAVLDLRPLLSAPATPLSLTGRVVVLHRDGVTVGLLTERVEGVVPLDPERLEPVLPTLTASAAALIAGQVTDPAGPIALVDLDTVLRLRHQLPRVRRAG
ncbi:MAG: chemotaxis protein CheW [Frankiaceae bacterium]